jgi:hypothetical protein
MKEHSGTGDIPNVIVQNLLDDEGGHSLGQFAAGLHDTQA